MQTWKDSPAFYDKSNIGKNHVEIQQRRLCRSCFNTHKRAKTNGVWKQHRLLFGFEDV